jgi:hypothetical protein
MDLAQRNMGTMQSEVLYTLDVPTQDLPHKVAKGWQRIVSAGGTDST